MVRVNRRSRALVPTVLLGMALPLGAQGVPTRNYAKAEAEFAEPFSGVSGVRGLATAAWWWPIPATSWCRW